MALAPIILSHKMEKQTSNDPSGDTKDMDDLKASRMPSAARDVALGQMLEVEATPEQERRVVWKLDLVYVLVYWFSRINLTNQIDTHDGRVLYDAVYGQIRLESGNIVQLARGSCMLSFPITQDSPDSLMLTGIEPPRQRIQLDIISVLLWISCLVLAEFLSDGPVAYRKVSQRVGVREPPSALLWLLLICLGLSGEEC